MSLSSPSNRNDYLGNGAVSVYAYSYKILDDDHITVTVRDTADVETTLTKTTDYTVSGIGTSTGGNITLVDASQAWLTLGNLTTGYTLTIRRILPIVQNTDIRNQGAYFPETIEDALDFLTMLIQQLDDEIDRSIILSETVDPADFDTSLPADIADHPGEVIVVNPTGDGFVMGGNPATVPLYYTTAETPPAPPAGRLAFWDDPNVAQSKKWSPFTNDWEVITA